MGENSAIEWTHHTFNPWHGCTRVSPGCEHCYAETFAGRFGTQWGPKAERRFFGNKKWAEPLKWNAKAAAAGERHRVFCASMADVFEDREDLVGQRVRLAALIAATPHLDWLLLTKRPENMISLTTAFWPSKWPTNVWAGATVEDQKRADERISQLLRVPARVRFLSCEPVLGPINLGLRTEEPCHFVPFDAESLAAHGPEGPRVLVRSLAIDWVICGGESGPGARPMHPVWARSLRDQCLHAGVAFFMKQWGAWAPIDRPKDQSNVRSLAQNEQWLNFKGGHGFHGEDVWRMRRVGKSAAGRILDGRTWDEFPPALVSSIAHRRAGT